MQQMEGEDQLNGSDKRSSDPMSASLSEMRIPRGRLLIVENGAEIEIPKREMPESE